jgi:hypothetical protein
MLIQTLPVAHFGDLVLVRLLAPAKKMSLSVVRKSLDPLFARKLSASEWQALLDERLERLEREGMLRRQPLALTEAGRAQALAFLDLEQLPARRDWKTLKNRHLIPKALGVSGDMRGHLAGADGLRAWLIKHHYQLPIGERPTLLRAIDAAIAQKLGLDPSAGLRIGAIRSQFLKRTLQPTKSTTLQELVELAAAQTVEALNPRIESLREAVLTNWLKVPSSNTAQTAILRPPVWPLEPELPAERPAVELAGFAERVRETARNSSSGWFGDNKVFIAHVWRQLQQEAVFPGLTEVEFKRRLTDANRAGLLQLSRADLVQVMNQDDVRASETTYLDAVFHFVQTER